MNRKKKNYFFGLKFVIFMNFFQWSMTQFYALIDWALNFMFIFYDLVFAHIYTHTYILD